MKKTYEALELEIIRFGAEDVITASAEQNEDPAPDKTDGGGSSSGSSGGGGEQTSATTGVFHYGEASGVSESHVLTETTEGGKTYYVDENGVYWDLRDNGEYYNAA